MMAQDWAFIVYGMIAFIGLLVVGFVFIAFSRKRRPLEPGEEYRPGRGPKEEDHHRPMVT